MGKKFLHEFHELARMKIFILTRISRIFKDH